MKHSIYDMICIQSIGGYVIGDIIPENKFYHILDEEITDSCHYWWIEEEEQMLDMYNEGFDILNDFCGVECLTNHFDYSDRFSESFVYVGDYYVFN